MCSAFIFVSCKEKGCYRIVSLGHRNLDCRSYCGLSRRMQGCGGSNVGIDWNRIARLHSHVLAHMISLTASRCTYELTNGITPSQLDFNMSVIFSSQTIKRGHKLEQASILICLLDQASEAPFANITIPKVARNAFNIGEIWISVCCYGN